MLEILTNAYNDSTDWGTQRQILSLFANNYSFQDLQFYIPNLTKYKYTIARKHSVTSGSGQPVASASYVREGVTQEQVDHFIDFVMSPCIMTDSPYGESHLKLSSDEVFQVPKIILNSVRSRVVEQYLTYCQETGFSENASARSYMRILEAVEPSVRKCMKGLDNYAAEGAKALDDLKKIASLLGKLSKGAEWQERVLTSLTAGKQYLKMEYKMHISSESEIADHCCQYALSDDSEEFSSSCCNNHNVSCRSCSSLADVLQELENAAKEVTFDNEDQQDNTMYTLSQSIKAVEEWKKHILRSVNQDKARSDIMMSLQDNEVLVERDWAMKFLEMLYRESQSKWFGKRGLNWHVSVGNYKIEEEFYTHTIVHVFDSAIQDAKTSNAVLKDTLARLHARNPAFNTAFVRSDNAGCFHGTETVCCVPSLSKSTGITIKKWTFLTLREVNLFAIEKLHILNHPLENL